MRRHFDLLLPALLLILAVGEAASRNYANELEDADLESKLQLLSPRSILEKNKATVYRDGTAANDTCGRDIVLMQSALIMRKSWALKMLDAASKIPSGLLEGNFIDLGMYDECVSAKGIVHNIEIHGRHCMYSIQATHLNISLPLNPTLSICVPSTCSQTDIARFLNETINTIAKIKDPNIRIASVNCAVIDKKIWDTEFIVCFCIIGGFISFLIICSLCDAIDGRLAAGQSRPRILRGLRHFSLQRSTNAILNTRETQDNVPVIHGLRFLSMTWVVLGHEHVVRIFGANVNNLYIAWWVTSWQSLYILVAPFAVDTFFTMSGFLMTYLFIKKMPKQKGFNIPMYYLHRFIRLTPPVIAIVVFTIVFIPKIGSGARWDYIMSLSVDGCRTKWWPFIFFIQNFVDQDNMCLGHLWYLAVDMQLFWISPLILYPLYKRPKVGLLILTFLLCVSLVAPAFIIGINKYPMLSFIDGANVTLSTDMFKNVYEMPYARAAPWIIGILFGSKVATKERRLQKKYIWAGWLAAVTSFGFCIFGTRSFIDPTYVYNPVWETFFSTISKPIWGFGVCWIIYASIHNVAGPVSTILSWKIFVPLSRISYCIYIVHFVIELMQVASQRMPIYYSSYRIVLLFFGDFAISIAVAFFFSLLFESPVLVLEKILFRRTRDSQYGSQKELIPSGEEDITVES